MREETPHDVGFATGVITSAMLIGFAIGTITNGASVRHVVVGCGLIAILGVLTAAVLGQVAGSCDRYKQTTKREPQGLQTGTMELRRTVILIRKTQIEDETTPRLQVHDPDDHLDERV